MKVKSIKVSDKGQISIPLEIREEAGIEKGDELLLISEKGKIMLEKTEKISSEFKRGFKDLLKHSEQVAESIWENSEDAVWDTV